MAVMTVIAVGSVGSNARLKEYCSNPRIRIGSLSCGTIGLILCGGAHNALAQECDITHIDLTEPCLCLMDARGEWHDTQVEDFEDTYKIMNAGDLTRAKNIQEFALSFLNVEGPSHDLCRAFIISNLGQIAYAGGDFLSSAELYRRSLEIFDSVESVNNEYLAVNTTGSLAIALEAIGDLASAKEIYHAIEDDVASLFGTKSKQYGIFQSNLAKLYAKAGSVDESIDIYASFFQNLAEIFPDDGAYQAVVMQNYAISLEKAGRIPEAEAISRRALELMRNHYGNKHLMYGVALYNLAALLANQERRSEAQVLFEEMLDVFSGAPADNPLVQNGLEGYRRFKGGTDRN